MDTTLYLPVDIVFNILMRLPARFLHNHGRFVCQSWATIINDPKFIKSHALAQNEEDIEDAELERIMAGNHILASSSGILLLQSKSNKGHLSVANPVTHQILKLPPLPDDCRRAGIGYVPPTGEIKVVSGGAQSLCALTVGGNMAWRTIHVEPSLRSAFDIGRPLFSLDGVLYYSSIYLSMLKRKMKLFAIDLGDESIHCINLPRENDDGACQILSTGKFLFSVRWSLSAFNTVVTGWKLKDFRKSEWGEPEIFDMRQHLGFEPSFYNFLVHKNTLVSW